ncbi:MAG TPA: DUF1236 domain-containing protein [Xanthobacteraceae bacterium]|nr:DUF1236 domain-containing protein [Xanthobacteraceae bacterium]
MRSMLQRAVLLFGLAGLGVAAVFALEAGRLPERDARFVGAGASTSPGDASDVTGTIEAAPRQRLPLSDEQRGHVFDDIMKLADAPVADVPTPDTTVVIPRSVALQELPESATRDVPQVAGYKFVKLDDRILLVSPADRSVVAEMPRYHTVLE